MQKLNNRGWGLGTMMAFIVFFVFVLLIIAIIAYNFGLDKGSPNHQIKIEENKFVSPENE